MTDEYEIAFQAVERGIDRGRDLASGEWRSACRAVITDAGGSVPVEPCEDCGGRGWIPDKNPYGMAGCATCDTHGRVERTLSPEEWLGLVRDAVEREIESSLCALCRLGEAPHPYPLHGGGVWWRHGTIPCPAAICHERRRLRSDLQGGEDAES